MKYCPIAPSAPITVTPSATRNTHRSTSRFVSSTFFRAFVTSAQITLHVKSLSGRNGHHVLEACFKGVARALRDAVRVEGGGIPSTKEVL